MNPAGVESRELVLNGQRVGYTLRRSVRKTLGLRVDARGLTVGVPLRVSLREVEAFIRTHGEWILDKLNSRSARPEPVPFGVQDGAALPCLGEVWRLRLGRGNNRATWHELGPERILELNLRAGADPRSVLLKGLQQRALDLFRHRVEEFCLRIGRAVPAVSLSSATTRWGSCSLRSGIRLHWRLVHLPIELVDYVVAHEVAHLVEMNHSARFWSVVESVYPDYAAARARLRVEAASLPHI